MTDELALSDFSDEQLEVELARRKAERDKFTAYLNKINIEWQSYPEWKRDWARNMLGKINR